MVGGHESPHTILCRISYLFGCVYLWKFIAIRSMRTNSHQTHYLSAALTDADMQLYDIIPFVCPPVRKIQIILSNVFIFNFIYSDCACAGKMPPGYMSDSYNSSLPFNPIATNGEPFPWFLPNLPNNVRPIRYALTIHPNLTTLDVKGKKMFYFPFLLRLHVARQQQYRQCGERRLLLLLLPLVKCI